MKIVSPTCMLAATNQVPCLFLCSEPVKSLSVFMWSLGSQYSHISMINEAIIVSLFHKWYYASLVFTVNKYGTTHSRSEETFFLYIFITQKKCLRYDENSYILVFKHCVKSSVVEFKKLLFWYYYFLNRQFLPGASNFF